MKRLALLALGMVILAGGAYAVEPAYTGPYGNVEEPALRPYKWAVEGVKGLFWHSGKSVQEGNLKFPVLGTVELGRGIRKGSVEMGESLYRGAIFSALPEKKHEYRNLHAANERIEESRAAREIGEAIPTVMLFTLFGYPVQKLVDRYPARDEMEVAVIKQEKAEKREAQRVAREAKLEADPDALVREAQIRYVGDRILIGDGKTEKTPKEHRGNLLKLAKTRQK